MWLDELMKAYLGKILPVMTGNVTNILFGIIIIVLMIFAPQGLVGLLDEAKRYLGVFSGVARVHNPILRFRT